MLAEPGIAIYVSLAVALLVWGGVFVYLWRLDVLARQLRQKLESEPERPASAAPTATLERRTPGEHKPVARGEEA
jgi:hypothetical protein